MSLSTVLSRDTVTTRLIFNMMKRNKYEDYLKDTMVGDLKWSAITDTSLSIRGWLKCDGSSLSRTTYSALFAVISTTYGYVDGTHFNLPNCNGRVLAAPGLPYVGGSNLIPGNSFGYQKHTLSVEEMVSHTHGGTTNASTTGITTNATGPGGSGYGLAYQDGDSTMNASVNPGNEPNLYTAIAALNINDPGHNHIFTTNATGGSQPFDIQQPTIVIGHVFIYSGVYDPLEPNVDILGLNDTEYSA